MNYFELNIGDWLKKTQGVSTLDQGYYFRLLLWYYGEETALPVDVVDIYAIVSTRSTKERESINRVLAKYFTLHKDGWHNKKADEVITSYRKRSAANSRNGRIGGEANAKRIRSEQVSESESEIEGTQYPVPNTHNPVTSNQRRREGARPRDQAEVLALLQERSYPDPVEESRKFWLHYEANGWVQGKNKPIKNWKAAAAGWAARHKDFKSLGVRTNGKQELTGDDIKRNTDRHGANFEAIEAEFRNRNQ